jgi:peptide/nickel transport system permease protein
LGVIGVLVVAGDVLVPFNPGGQNVLLSSAAPSSTHWLGTDQLGRDILSRTLVGARTPVVSALLIAAITTTVSGAMGIAAGYLGGRLEGVAMRTVDFFLALPPLLVIIVVAGALSNNYAVSVLLLALLQTPWDLRLVRAATLEQRHKPFVEACSVMGLSRLRTMTHHLLPNIMPLLVVNMCLDFSFGLVALSGLTFVGLGVAPGTPDWGRMLFENQTLLFTNPAALLAPAGMIMSTAAAANLVGDAAFERLGRERRRPDDRSRTA